MLPYPLFLRCAWLGLLAGAVLSAGVDKSQNVLRWAEGRAGCTFSADEDGKYRYGLWTDDLGIVVAVDADEVRQARLRVESLFAIYLSLRYRGKESLPMNPADISLEFVNHYHAVPKAIDPDDFARKLQTKADAFAAQMAHEIERHPEKQSMLQAHENDLTKTREFVQSESLRPMTLQPAHPVETGWILFNTNSKWLGDWKSQEKFLLRISVANRIVEFPFALPPSRGDLILRRR
ncbi:MAG TPA: hypothetical protein VEI26_15345 [Terriglobales bacterium]|nr:hypothetical protein [Terriglobales bacterium]